VLVFAILVVLIWAYLLFFHAGFWRIRRFELTSQPVTATVEIAVIVPARNEAEVIPRSVSSLLRQDFAGSLHLFVVDDNSTDGTAKAARAAAAMPGLSDRLTVIQGAELPAGWTGKVWAMQQGWLAARPSRPDYVLLTDADVEHAPDNLSRLLVQAEKAQRDLVSVLVKLRCETLAEKFLIPAFVYFFFLLYPPSKISDSCSPVAGAAGGCILIRSSVLEGIGGLESIRGEIIDDCALAGRVKKSGGRLWLGVTRDTRSIRGYGSFGNIRDIIARTAFNQLRHSLLLLVLCVIGMLITFVLPLALVWARNTAAECLAVTACAFMFVSYLPVLRLYRVNILSVVILPFAAIFYVYATVVSAWRYWSGRGGQWKGRAQDQMPRSDLV
jgi:hopene-associated glycosyltransferase HpnB